MKIIVVVVVVVVLVVVVVVVVESYCVLINNYCWPRVTAPLASRLGAEPTFFVFCRLA